MIKKNRKYERDQRSKIKKLQSILSIRSIYYCCAFMCVSLFERLEW